MSELGGLLHRHDEAFAQKAQGLGKCREQTTTANLPEPVCTRCRSAPPMVAGMSICKGCLQRQVEHERAEREHRMQQMTKERRLERRYARPIGRQDK